MSENLRGDFLTHTVCHTQCQQASNLVTVWVIVSDRQCEWHGLVTVYVTFCVCNKWVHGRIPFRIHCPVLKDRLSSAWENSLVAKPGKMTIQRTLDFVDEKFFTLIEDLDERKIFVVLIIQTFISSFIVTHASVEIIDCTGFICTHVIRTRHFDMLHSHIQRSINFHRIHANHAFFYTVRTKTKTKAFCDWSGAFTDEEFLPIPKDRRQCRMMVKENQLTQPLSLPSLWWRKSSTSLLAVVKVGHVHLCRVTGNAVWSHMAGDAAYSRTSSRRRL